jgi:lipoate---protein ligase
MISLRAMDRILSRLCAAGKAALARRQEGPMTTGPMPLRVIDAGEASAGQSQALWYGIAREMAPDDAPVLTLVNPRDPYVCIGFHQNVRLEVDEDYCASREIAVLRRRLGGGAVYIDHNQLIFHFMIPRRRAPNRVGQLYPMFIEPVVRTYRDLGIDAAYRPLNDIQVAGRKIGGTAAAILEEATVLGGMFLFDFDAATMAHCLKVPSEKFRDKLHKTLDDYVTSMRRLLPKVPAREVVKSLFLRHVADCLNLVPGESAANARERAAIEGEVACLRDPGWTARIGRKFVGPGVKVAADTYLTEGLCKAPGGLVRVQLLSQADRILDIEISGDFTCQPPEGLARLAERLQGASLSPTRLAATIADLLDGLRLELPGVEPEHLAAAIAQSREFDP